MDERKILRPTSTLRVPTHRHVLSVLKPGKKMLLEGYHEHNFFGDDLRILVGAARHVAWRHIVFSKQKGKWRVTKYCEVNRPASELPWDAVAARAEMRD